MKKLFSILSIVGFLVIHPLTYAATVAVSNVSATPGERNISVVINVANIERQDICGIDIELDYDPALIKARKVLKGHLTSDWNLKFDIKKGGKIKIALYGASALSQKGGSVIQINFDVPSKTQPGKISNLTMKCVKLNEVSVDSIVNGSVSVIPKKVSKSK